MIEPNKIYNEDCLEGMRQIPDGSVDCIICDLPYGQLNKSNKYAMWDKTLPMDKVWKQYERITKDNGAIILFAQGVFTAKLMLSNEKMWRYNLVWNKINRPTGFLDANRRPLRIHEDICVFYKRQPIYNPQFKWGAVCHARGKAGNAAGGVKNRCYGQFKVTEAVLTNKKYPCSILDIPKEHKNFHHPTQKPVALIEYLVRTYTNEGDTVLDNCMGSGTTAVACINTNRNYIGFELDKGYYDIAVRRIEEAKRAHEQDLFNNKTSQAAV